VKRAVLLAAALAAVVAVPALRLGAQTAATPWVHIRVDEPSKSSKVSVNLPLTVVQAALKSAPDTLGSHGRVHFGRHGGDMSVADFRRLWTELKAAGDADLVEVQDEDQSVHLSRRGEIVEVRVEGNQGARKARGAEQVHVQVPVALVDALLSGSGDELNVEAAIGELQKRRGEIVQVNGEDGTVRIWIDEGAQKP
jgi:hypothetical protein